MTREKTEGRNRELAREIVDNVAGIASYNDSVDIVEHVLDIQPVPDYYTEGIEMDILNVADFIEEFAEHLNKPGAMEDMVQRVVYLIDATYYNDQIEDIFREAISEYQPPKQTGG